MVIIQDMKILRITLRFKAPIPPARPTPNTAPTNVCVAETGTPVLVDTTTVLEAARVAAKARLGVNTVIELPTVAMTLRPSTSPIPKLRLSPQKTSCYLKPCHRASHFLC